MIRMRVTLILPLFESDRLQLGLGEFDAPAQEILIHHFFIRVFLAEEGVLLALDL
jgi:hypothetical protein